MHHTLACSLRSKQKCFVESCVQENGNQASLKPTLISLRQVFYNLFLTNNISTWFNIMQLVIQWWHVHIDNPESCYPPKEYSNQFDLSLFANHAVQCSTALNNITMIDVDPSEELQIFGSHIQNKYIVIKKYLSCPPSQSKPLHQARARYCFRSLTHRFVMDWFSDDLLVRQSIGVFNQMNEATNISFKGSKYTTDSNNFVISFLNSALLVHLTLTACNTNSVKSNSSFYQTYVDAASCPFTWWTCIMVHLIFTIGSAV